MFARYDAMGVLDRLASAARRGGRGLWLLVPQSDPSREPRLGQVAVPYQAGLGEWIAASGHVGGQRPSRVRRGCGKCQCQWCRGRRQVIDRKALLNDLKQQVKAVETDLGRQVKALADVGARLRAEYDQARKLGRTAATWTSWLDERVTQVAVAWVLGTVFVRFCEDNGLIPEPYLTGPDGDRRELAEARYDAYVETDDDPTYRGWLEQAFEELGAGPGGPAAVRPAAQPAVPDPAVARRGAGAGRVLAAGGTRRASLGPRLHRPAERGRHGGLGHPVPGRPVPGPERGRPEDVRAAPDAGVRGGVHPRPDDEPGGAGVRRTRS